MYFITTKRMLEVCFSVHPNIQYRTVFSCLFCINDSDIPDYPDLLHILSILYIRKSNRHPVINRVY